MPDFWAALIGAVVGTVGTLGAAAVAFRAALTVDRRRAERQAVADLTSAAYDFDTALLTLSEAISRERDDISQLDEDVRRTGRRLDQLAYLVADADLRRLALALEKVGFGVRAALTPSSSGDL